MEMDRRTALALLASGVVAGRLEAAQQHLHAVRARPGDYRLQFFSASEHELIDVAAEMILPADHHSPGAGQARVAHYIDLVVANSPERTKLFWKSRLAAFDNLARERHGQPFLKLSASSQAEVMNAIARQEANPVTEAEHFFVDMKRMAILGYYTSEIGLLQELEYKGNAALASFPGCTHGPRAHR